MLNLTTLRLAFKFAPWVAILLLLAWTARINDLRGRHLRHYQSEHAGRMADRATYTAAQATAEAMNKAQVERIKSEQERITSHVETSYEADLARLRAELAKRLHGGNAAPQGAPVSPGASPVPHATGKPDGSSGVRISSDDYVRAAETENQLEHLIQWVEQQMKVDPNAK